MNHIRLRIQDEIGADQWVSHFEQALKEAGFNDQVEIRKPRQGAGLAALDPQVLSAIIQGGATVISAALSAVIAAYVAVKNKDKKPDQNTSQFRVSIQTVYESKHLMLDAQPLNQLNTELQNLPDIEQIREISIIEECHE